MNVWFVVIGFVLIHYVSFGEIFMYVCMYFLVLLWSGCGISLPEIGHFNNGYYIWTRCKLYVWIGVCGVECFFFYEFLFTGLCQLTLWDMA